MFSVFTYILHTQVYTCVCVCLESIVWMEQFFAYVHVYVYIQHMFVLRNSSCSSNAMWVDMLCQLSSCWQFDWLLCSCSDGQEWLAADFSGGQRRVAGNHLGDLTAFIIDRSWSWSGLSTQSDGKHWSGVNRMRLDETLRNESLWFVVRVTQVYRCDY